jgi:hypothetical protein
MTSAVTVSGRGKLVSVEVGPTPAGAVCFTTPLLSHVLVKIISMMGNQMIEDQIVTAEDLATTVKYVSHRPSDHDSVGFHFPLGIVNDDLGPW